MTRIFLNTPSLNSAASRSVRGVVSPSQLAS